jgi:lipopolysaccharide biosynthesis regulator YciM
MGKQANVDNWRRAADATAQLRTDIPNNTRGNPAVAGTDVPTPAISYEALLENIPLTPEKLKVSNEVILSSLVVLADAYVNDLEDYASAIQTYEAVRSRFPEYLAMSEVLLNLYYSYTKTGNTAKAAEIKVCWQKIILQANRLLL